MFLMRKSIYFLPSSLHHLSSIKPISPLGPLKHFRNSLPFRRRPVSFPTFRPGRNASSYTPFRHLHKRNLSQAMKLRSQPTPNLTASLNSPQQSLSLSQRLKKLSREYGWSAFGVYMALSALDFPFCFLAVRVLGTERIGRWEHIVVDGAKRTIYYPLKSAFGWEDGNALEEGGHAIQDGVRQVVRAGDQKEIKSNVGWGVEEAEEAAHKSDATLWTQLVLAYAIHKSFIFIRVPLTAAVTPKVVKTLRGWGWDIGKRKPKTPGAMASASR